MVFVVLALLGTLLTIWGGHARVTGIPGSHTGSLRIAFGVTLVALAFFPVVGEVLETLLGLV
jgi:hypothetical protein